MGETPPDPGAELGRPAPRYLVWTGLARADYRLEYAFALPTGADADTVRVGAVHLPEGEAPAPASAAAPTFAVAAETAVSDDAGASVVTARLLLAELVSRSLGRWSLRGCVTIDGTVWDLPLEAPAGYVCRESLYRGVSVTWGRDRRILVRVRRRAAQRGVSRLLALLSDKLRGDVAPDGAPANPNATLHPGFSDRSSWPA